VLIIHGLVAVVLLGATTHQSLATWIPMRTRPGSFFGRFHAVPSAAFANAIVLLYVASALLARSSICISASMRVGRRVPAERWTFRLWSGWLLSWPRWAPGALRTIIGYTIYTRVLSEAPTSLRRHRCEPRSRGYSNSHKAQPILSPNTPIR
jgi:hypothetical protein